ncbi:hypothetical protein ACWEQ7_00145 [Streptomyces sp. NPDC004069]
MTNTFAVLHLPRLLPLSTRNKDAETRGASTARLLTGRTPGPVSAAHRRPGPGTGGNLYECRHPGLTHLGEAGVGLLRVKSRR